MCAIVKKRGRMTTLGAQGTSSFSKPVRPSRDGTFQPRPGRPDTAGPQLRNKRLLTCLRPIVRPVWME
ncbi:hypothetical protein RB213_010926 [Colletotrichum asianum]